MGACVTCMLIEREARIRRKHVREDSAKAVRFENAPTICNIDSTPVVTCKDVATQTKPLLTPLERIRASALSGGTSLLIAAMSLESRGYLNGLGR